MFFITVNIHQNILSAHCVIKCDLQNTTINNVKVACARTYLSVNFYNGCDLVHGVKILTPKNFFIPSSVLKQDSSLEKVELENDILTITRYCHSYSLITNAELQIPENNSPQKSEESIFNPNCKEDVDAIDNNTSYSDNNVEISFRIQILSGDLISSCSLGPQSTFTLYDFFKKEIQCPESYQVICTNCNKELSKRPVSFLQVREYCDNLLDFSESWYCHQNGVTELEFDKNTLYVSETCIFLHSSISKSLSMKNDFSKDTKCETCSTVLSCGSKSDLQCFYPEAIMLIKPEFKPYNSEEYYDKIVLSSLWTIITKKSYMCRLLIQSKVEGIDRCNDECILMWIPPMKTAQFKLQSMLPALPTQVDFSTQDVYQVQYYAGPFSSPHVQTWKKDFNVDFFMVGSAFINTLKKLLTSSTESTSNRKDEEFSTGCLPCCFPDI